MVGAGRGTVRRALWGSTGGVRVGIAVALTVGVGAGTVGVRVSVAVAARGVAVRVGALAARWAGGAP